MPLTTMRPNSAVICPKPSPKSYEPSGCASTSTSFFSSRSIGSNETSNL
jgi:hypothetical protein